MFDMNDFDGRIDRICHLSPQAAKLMETEGYRTRLETDEVTERAVLEDLMIALIEDFQDIGVEFHCSPGELFDSYFLLDRLLEVFTLLMPAPLYQAIRQETRFRTVLGNILDGSTVEDGDSTVLSWLKFVGYGSDKLSAQYEEAVEHLIDKVASTPVFDTMLTNLLALDPNILPEIDSERSATYHSFVEKLELKLTQIADLVFLKFKNETVEPLVRKRLRAYLMDLTRVDNLELYSWLFVPESENPGLTEQQFRMEKWRDFAASSKLHPEYYLRNPTKVDTAAIVGLLIRLAANTTDRITFRNAAAELQATLSHGGAILQPTDLSTMALVTRAIAESLEKPE